MGEFEFFEGLIELASPIELNERVQPAKLPNECQSDDSERLVAIGNGLIQFDMSKIQRPLLLRQAVYQLVSYDDCVLNSEYLGDPGSIICIHPTAMGSVHMGDSGK